MRRGWRGASVALVAVAALGGGCSSANDGAASTTTTAPSGRGPTTTEGAPVTTKPTGTGVAPGSSSAEAALIEASDLGASWDRDVDDPPPEESISETFLSVPACSGLADGARPSSADDSASADYTTSDGGTDASIQLQVVHQVDVYPSEADAAAVVSVLESDDFATCFEALLVKAAGEGDPVTDMRATPLGDVPSASALGVDGAAGVEVTGQLATPRGSAAITAHIVVLQRGSALGAFTVSQTAVGSTTRPPPDVEQGAVEAAAEQLSSAG